jgi:hypothetical protein
MNIENTSSGGLDDRMDENAVAKGAAGGSAPLPSEGEDLGKEAGGFAAVSAAEALALALSPPQRKAIELLTSGHTLVDSAKAAGVGRTTLYRWLHGDATFMAAFNTWQQDALATARGRLLALSDLAVATVGKAMSHGDAKTAVAVLKSLGVMDRPTPGPTDADELRRVQDLEARKQKVVKDKQEWEVMVLEAGM